VFTDTSVRCRRSPTLGYSDSASRVTVNDATSARSWPARVQNSAHLCVAGIDDLSTPTLESVGCRPPSLCEPVTGGVRSPLFRKGTLMNLLKNVCVVVPAVLLTATVVVAVATVVGLSSWEVL
jgi:hypothetical protein